VMVTNKDSYERMNLNANLDADLANGLTSRTTVFYRYSERSNPVAQYGLAITGNRMYDPTGYFELPNGDVLPFDTPGNIVRYRYPGQTNVQTLRIFQQFEYEVMDDLTLFGEFTTQRGSTKTLGFNNQPRFANRFLFEEESSDQTRTQYNRGYNDHVQNGINVYADYHRNFGAHNLNLMTGYNWEGRENEGFSVNRTHMISNEVPGINTAIGDYGGGDSHGAWAVIGYFGRVNYNYDSRYLLEGNVRYDGSSRFAQGSRFGLFPSVSAGWNISNESFMQNVDPISSLRLRASWGEVGNQNVADLYPTYPGYTTPEVRWLNLLNDERFVSILPANLVSPLLTWERVRTANAGLDLALFNNRFNATVDVYRRETLDMLAPGRELPAILGTPAPFANVADLETMGWELALNWRDVRGDFRYRVNFSLYDSKTTITQFDNPSGLLSQYYIGMEIGEIWGYVTDGFYTIDDFVEGTLDAHLSGPNRQLKHHVPRIDGAPNPFPGDVKYKDLNGDGVINHGNNTLEDPGDRTIIGNSSPRYQFGLNGNVGYKNWDFSFVITGVGKRDLNLDGHVMWPWPSQFGNLYAHQLDFWMPDNQNAFFPRVHGNPFDNSGSNYGQSRRTQTKYLSDGRYMRINNITLGYTLPQSLMGPVGVEKLRVHVSLNNIYTWHNLPTGLDPDQPDTGAYPFMRQLSAGINLVF
jgi:TonB-linked SusC/RagA family outer membrane protein